MFPNYHSSAQSLRCLTTPLILSRLTTPQTHQHHIERNRRARDHRPLVAAARSPGSSRASPSVELISEGVNCRPPGARHCSAPRSLIESDDVLCSQSRPAATGRGSRRGGVARPHKGRTGQGRQDETVSFGRNGVSCVTCVRDCATHRQAQTMTGTDDETGTAREFPHAHFCCHRNIPSVLQIGGATLARD